MARFEVREVPKEQAIGERKYRVWDNELDRFTDRPAMPFNRRIASILAENRERLEARIREVQNG